MLSIIAVMAIPSISGAVGSEVGNFVNIVVLRINDPEKTDAFTFDVDVVLGLESGVTGVTVTTGGGSQWSLTLEDLRDGDWFYSVGMSSVDEIITESNGMWTIDIDGDSPSTTTFTIDTADYVDSDYFSCPTGLVPANGAVDVPADTDFSWADPTGGMDAEAMVIDVDGPTLGQDDNTFDGSLQLGQTMWTAPQDLEPGLNAWEIGYGIFDENRVGIFDVTAGAIEWGDSPIAPENYPATSPVLVRGSNSRALFTVIAHCPADLDANGQVNVLDLLQMLGAWGACGVCPADLNGDGTVNVLDLLQMLGDWGSC